MEIDHLFVFVEPDGAELAYLNSLGLVETYRRAHPGQGTQNICFCFDNMFLECIWVSNVGEIQSDVIARTRLYERSQWRNAGTSPFGIAWRTTGNGAVFEPATWEFRPPYLPSGTSIDVCVDSDDPRQPMMFRSPGATPPVQWPHERRRNLQRSAGLGSISATRLELPRTIAVSPALAALSKYTSLEVQPSSSEIPSLTLEVERLDQGTTLTLRLPLCP
jgi:hypothetical protein